ncbi:MAG: hypothetical protein ACOCX1_05400 [Fimbriimonadaceae bacterium]
MVKCALTGKPIDKVPSWLDDVNVKFISSSASERSVTELSSGETKTKSPNADVGAIDEKDSD